MNFKRTETLPMPLNRPQDIFRGDYLGRLRDDRYKAGALRTRPEFYIRAFNRMLDSAKNEADVADKISMIFALRGGLVSKALAAENPHGAYDALAHRLDVAKTRKNVTRLTALKA